MLNERGYPYARVQALEGPGAKPNTVTITLAAEPGRQAKFGPVEITGNSSVSKELIQRQLAFGEGDQFRMSRVAESQRRLYNLELFQYVNFDVPDLAAQPEKVPVKAIITEGKHRRVGFGVGYGSEDKARVTANWRHVNFFGGARTLGLEGKYSSLDRGVRANFTEPYFFSPSYKLTLSRAELVRERAGVHAADARRPRQHLARDRPPRSHAPPLLDHARVGLVHQRVRASDDHATTR